MKLEQIITPNTWVASDHHFGHKRLAEFEPMREAYRKANGYTSLEEMVIQRHNDKVKPTDKVLFLGDVAWNGLDKYIHKLNGDKYLVLGNHDTKGNEAYKHFKHVFRGVYVDINGFTLHHEHPDKLMSMLYIDGVVFSHYALFHRDEYDFQRGSFIEPRMDYCESLLLSLNLPVEHIVHGHLHSKTVPNKSHMYKNVCLEHTELAPVQLKDILPHKFK